MTSSTSLSPEPREIDYRIRPAKNVERKMLVELGYRLGRVEPIESYRYVGMGSIYFADFALFHRAFGMQTMISLEGRPSLVERCIYNRPFDCIEVREQEVSAALPTLRSDQPTVMWLDYDGPLSSDRLTEIRMAVEILAPGSLLLVTVNVHPDLEEKVRVERFRARFGSRDVARIAKPSDLSGKKLASLSHEYIDAEIRDAVSTRSAIDGVAYQQLVHFRYSDSARMLTVGGVVVSPAQAETSDRWQFSELDFYRPGAEAFEIRIPKLTHRERTELDRLLPKGRLDDAPPTLDPETVKLYADVYRQVPVYVDAVL